MFKFIKQFSKHKSITKKNKNLPINKENILDLYERGFYLIWL